ncbi:MAG: potassium transporter TrkA [Oceanospirillaceae bacterium]|nr:potassium transporter TrkA [Oceanospirillaceae bacterium]
MYDILYVLLRRLRTPLITLIVVYAVSILGFTLIPGQDDQGNPWRMDFFHAFYFVSFMGSTIGFGEIPYPFTAAQRMWTLVTIYSCVIAWLYGIGTTLSVLQDGGFIRLLRLRRFIYSVKGITEPFYLVCGYGVTGSTVVRELVDAGLRAVVVDIDQERIDNLDLDGLVTPVPALCADASLPDVLDRAGLQHPHCAGVLALTNSDKVNLGIAIASKVLVPKRMAISRSENDITSANLASFGTDLIVDPFRHYAEYVALAAHSPHRHLVFDWLMNPHHRTLASVYRHAEGRWIVCGYGRFGRNITRELTEAGTEVTVIDPDPDNIRALGSAVPGVGTEAVTLEQAGVRSAVGIVAGTDSDADNLSIIMTARELNPKLITVVRQNLSANELIFSHSRCDFIMQPGQIIATRILAQLKTPLLSVFIEHLFKQDEVWAHTLINRMSSMVGDEKLDSRSVRIDKREAPAVITKLEEEVPIKLISLMKNPHNRSETLSCFPLMMKRGDSVKMTPGELTELEPGDEILFCGRTRALDRMRWSAQNYNTLHYILTGFDATQSRLQRWLRGPEAK